MTYNMSTGKILLMRLITDYNKLKGDKHLTTKLNCILEFLKKRISALEIVTVTR